MGQRARLLVLGRQGSGKGTQCARLASELDVPHVSSGDLLRAEVAAGTPLGRRAAAYLDRGELVPDEVVLDLIAASLGGPAARAGGYVLDGFPRTLAQGKALFDVLGDAAVDQALELAVPTEVVLPRLAARRTCEACGQPTVAVPGAGEVPCPACGGRLVRRADDTEEAIETRLHHYDTETGPLLDWLRGIGKLTTVDGVGDPDTVAARVLRAVARHVPTAVRRPA